MSGFFKRFPLTSVITFGTTVLAVLVFLQSTGILAGAAAHWVDVIAGVLQVLLTTYARQHVTPLASPHDSLGRRLVPAPVQPPTDKR